MNVAEAGRESDNSNTSQPGDCFSCRLIGTTALGAVGFYALNQSRRHQPGSALGKRIMAGVGICFLGASYVRWTTTMPKFRDNKL